MSEAIAEQFRADVLQFEDWTLSDYKLAETLATLMKFGAATYDGDTGIVSSSTSQMRDIIAAGGLCMPDNVLLWFNQQPQHDYRVCLVDEGIRVVMKIGGVDTWIRQPLGKVVFPSVKEILSEVVD